MLIPNTSCVARILMLVCAFSWAGLAAQSTIADCDLFADGPNDTWTHVLTLTTVNDDNSSAAQSFQINVTALPDAGANFRVFKTTANGSSFFGPATALDLGSNGATIPAVGFDRAVKIQFSSGAIGFDSLILNGEADTQCAPAAEPGTALSDCPTLFADGPNDAWTHALTLTTPEDDGSSNAQTMDMVVTSLPDGGANYRVAKTTSNGNWFNGPAQAMTLGSNSVTVAGVGFDRSVKIQFSSGDIAFSSVSINGEAQSCEPAGPTTHPVTFSVNTDNIEVGDLGMYIGGGFLGGANAYALNDNGNNNWSITLDLEEGTSGNWVFLNSPCCDWNWDTKEDLSGEPCADVNNWNDRYLDAVTGPVTLEYCFGECTAECPEPPSVTYPVTFIVHTDNIDVGATGMHIGGGFLGGSNAYQLTDNGGDTWSITLDLFEGTAGHWVFFNAPGWDSDWGTKEDLAGLECGDPNAYNDRYLAPISGPTTLEYCFGTCDTECSSDVLGCTDSSFDNYNAEANVDDGTCANVSGAWQLASLCVGWDQANICGWWSYSAPGDRTCLEDDIYYMGENGTFQNMLGDDTWLEGWQSGTDEACGAPVAPHDGSNAATWSLANGEITLNGLGAYLGLPKAYNGGELNNDNTIGPESRTYIINSLSSTSLEVDIQVGGGWWRFGFARTSIAGCTDSAACNFNPTADTDDGSCGSTDDCGTCHVPYCYNPVTHIPAFGVSAADCTPPNLFISGTGGGMTNLDSPMSPSWNAACSGCMDMDACNYDESATVSDAAACTYPPHPNFDCDGNCNNDADGDGICDELEGLIPEAETACGIGTMWDADLGQCVFNVECAGDINLDGAITANDILLMLANFGTWCPGYGPDAE